MELRPAVLTAVAALALVSTGSAQDSRGTASATVGGQEVVIDYGQPDLKGRDLGELMTKLPPDRIWRAGENQVSTLTTGADLMIGGTKVPAGKYSVYVHAGESGEWSFILNTDVGVPLGKIWDGAPDNMKNEPWPHLGDYTESIADLEVVRAKMAPVKDAPAAELFTISFAPKGDGADLVLAWGDQAWKVGVEPAK